MSYLTTFTRKIFGEPLMYPHTTVSPTARALITPLLETVTFPLFVTSHLVTVPSLCLSWTLSPTFTVTSGA